jgi:hypothetical protein
MTGCGADVLAIGACHSDIGDEARQFRPQATQQRVVLRHVGRIRGNRPAEAEHEVFQIADMVVELGGQNAGFAERTNQGLGLLGAELIPQAGADQDKERKRGRRDQSQ